MILLNETWPAPQWYEGRAIDGHVISTILIFQYILHLRNWGCCQGRSLAEAGGFGWENGFCASVRVSLVRSCETWDQDEVWGPFFVLGNTFWEVMNSIVTKRAIRVTRPPCKNGARDFLTFALNSFRLIPLISFKGHWPRTAFRSVNESATICRHSADQRQSLKSKWLWFRSIIPRGAVYIYIYYILTISRSIATKPWVGHPMCFGLFREFGSKHGLDFFKDTSNTYCWWKKSCTTWDV